MIKTALIMAGGIGKRLRPLTYAVPKPLLPIGEKPIIEQIILDMKKQRINHFIISVNYKKEMIINYLKDGKSLGVEIEYLEEDTYTGTAGCLSNLNTEEDIIISNGDILCDVDYQKLFNLTSTYDLIITSIEKEYTIDFGVLEYDKNNCELKNWIEKPTYKYSINAGIYAIKNSIITFIKQKLAPNTYLDMPDLWALLKSNNLKLGIYEHKGKWEDVGRMEDYMKLNSN